MIYFCADDYGLCDSASAHISQCIDGGVLNKVSIFPNFDGIDFGKISGGKDIRVSLHLNLVEGKCMADIAETNMLTDKNGVFRHTFGGLFMLGLLRGKKLEAQVYEEIKAQILYWKSILPKDTPFCVDSHQHTHMIPAVFRALTRALYDLEIELKYMRIPAEPLLPYIKKPSLYLTYTPVNIVKQWLLKFLGMCNKKHIKKYKIPTAYFFGILFSGKMDEYRVKKILPEYIKLAEKNGCDVEVLFHPGYIDGSECDLEEKNIVFKDFYISKNRKTEFDSAKRISERGAY